MLPLKAWLPLEPSNSFLHLLGLQKKVNLIFLGSKY